MKIIFWSHAKTHFHNRGFTLSLVLKVRAFGTRTWRPASLLALTSFVCYYEVTQETGKIRPPKQSHGKSL